MFSLGFFRWLAAFAMLSAISAAQAQGVTTAVSGLSPAFRARLAAPGVRVVVFFFATTDCPISNRYVPEIERLDNKYTGHGVRVWWVYPDPTDDSTAIARHRKDFSITGALYPDVPQTAVELAHATVTPEAAVFVINNGQLQEVYHGRVDDRYIAIGQERPQATRHELEMAIEAALDGKAAPEPGGPPVGCAIPPPQK
jgi:AhpC/TSA family